jgi:hypothetical protein|nr:metallophosphoesterase [Kofleriaceae bacterium]
MWRRLAIMLSVLGSTHAFIWWRFLGAVDWPSPIGLVGTLAIAILAPSLPITMMFGRRLSRERAKPWLWICYSWFGFATYLLLAAIGVQIATAVGADARTAAEIGFAATVAVVGYGFIHVRLGPVVRRVRVPLAQLPASADGYTIVQLTDVHVGWTIGRAYLERVVAAVEALHPDLIVITGDLIDGSVRELQSQVEPLAKLSARDGVYAVTGNHEYYWNADAWLAHLGSLGLRFLRNERVRIHDAFELAGSDDITSAAMAPGHGEDIARATAGRDPALPLVLLAHHPSSIAGARAAGVDLQLSGHTHGGQLLPLGWLSRLFEPRVAGLARFGTTWLYVSEGTGFWGPPMRIGTSCEIAAITLARG